MSTLIERLKSPYAGLPGTFWVLWMGTLVNRMGDFVVPFLALYLTGVRHVPVADVGFLIAFYGFGSIGAGPSGGILADRLGRRTTLMLVMVLSAMTVGALGMVRSIALIGPLVALLGLFSQAYRPAMSATIADLVPPEDRPRAYGLMYWAVNIAFAFSSAVGGWLASRAFSTLFAVDAVTTLLFAGIIWRAVPETRPVPVEGARPVEDRSASPLRDPLFLVFAGLTFAMAMAMGQFNCTVPLEMRAHGISMATYGLLAGINGVMIVFLQPFAAPMLHKQNRSVVLAASALLSGVGMAVNGLAAGVAGYATSIAIWTLGEIAGSAVGPALVADFAPETHRGRYQGVFQVAWGAASCLGPIVGTQVLARCGANTLWLSTLIVGVAAAGAHLFIARALKQRLQKSVMPTFSAVQ